MPAISEKLLTKQAIARQIGCSPRTVDNLVKQGLIPSIKVRRLRRYLWSEVAEAIREAK
jgi:excisionase family DNA binding protein